MTKHMMLSCLVIAGVSILLAADAKAQFVGGAVIGGPPVVMGGPIVPMTPMVASPFVPMVPGGYTVIAPRPGFGFAPYGVGVRRIAPGPWGVRYGYRGFVRGRRWW